mgnify:CR=1 FL=1
MIKNCEPLVFGPEFAIEKTPGASCRNAGSNSSSNLYPGPPAPVPSGQRTQKGLSRRGRRSIRIAAQYYHQLVMANKTTKAYASFITLTYGKEWPNDMTAKKDLDNFLKRLRRKLGRNFHYVWVAERQKRGVIHFHILTTEYVPKAWLNQHWNETVNGRWTREGNTEAVQKLMPNVKGVYHVGGYMAKYISKEGENIVGNGYFVSSMTSKALKPVVEQ